MGCGGVRWRGEDGMWRCEGVRWRCEDGMWRCEGVRICAAAVLINTLFPGQCWTVSIVE